MKKQIYLVIILILTACKQIPTNIITQISTIDAILAGAYDGHTTCRELLRYGNIGIGTFNNLDGEMIIADGIIYQIKADGKVYTPPMNTTSPFASIVNMKPEKIFAVNHTMSKKQLLQKIDNKENNKNLFCAIRIEGQFSLMTTRSVPAQKKPYPKLTEITKNQPVFHLKNIRGTIIGFRSPTYVKGIGVPSYHLHFISADKTSGGHILDFTIQKGAVLLASCNKFNLILPQNSPIFAQKDLSKDRSKELHKAEQ